MYQRQSPLVYTLGTYASPKTLGTSYGTTNAVTFAVGNTDEITINFGYKRAAGAGANTLQIKVENVIDPTRLGSPDTANLSATTEYFRLASEATTSGTTTLYNGEISWTAVSAAGSWDYVSYTISTARCQALRISIKETVASGNAGSAYLTIQV